MILLAIADCFCPLLITVSDCLLYDVMYIDMIVFTSIFWAQILSPFFNDILKLILNLFSMKESHHMELSIFIARKKVFIQYFCYQLASYCWN